MAEAKDMGSYVVGSNQTFLDAPEKASGTAVYLDDLQMSGTLVGRALRSEHAHARIVSVDTKDALQVPGVAVILTGADLPSHPRASTHPRAMPIIAWERVLYAGDVLALVAAETAEAADEAIRRIHVRYEPLPVVVDPEEALAPGSPTLWEGGNLLNHARIRKGNIEDGFRAADIVIENEYRTQAVDHLYLEVESGFAAPLPDGGFQIWNPTQQPFPVRQNVARVLGLKSDSAIRFVQTLPGGGFGGKNEASIEISIRAALLARAAQKPVKLVYSREESLISSSKRHSTIIRSRTGATKDGRLVAAEVEIYLDKGAYSASGGDNPPAFKRATYHSVGPYDVANVKVDVYCVHTNHPYGGQMRGPGVPQVHFACEQQIDQIARALDMDPIEMRRINGLRVGSRTSANQHLPESVGLIKTLGRVEEASGWLNRNGSSRRTPDGRLRGFGVASCMYGTGNAYSPAEAHLHLTRNGKIRIAAGVVDFGQGSKTVLSQIAAETMNVPFDTFEVGAVDSQIDPFGGTSSSSRVTMQGGKAVYLAAIKAREELLRLGGHLLEVDPQDLDVSEGVIHSKSHPETRITLAGVAAKFVSDEMKQIGAADHIPPPAVMDKETGLGEPYEVYGFGTQAAEVLVDPDTGEIEVVGMWASHDVGKAISPLGVEQQIDGGVYMGLGFCLMEEIVQQDGRMHNPDLHGYLIPTVADIPGRLETSIVEEHYSNGPYGAKGVGEQVTCPTAAAIANAVCDATGVRFQSLPLSPDRVAMAIAGKKKG